MSAKARSAWTTFAAGVAVGGVAGWGVALWTMPVETRVEVHASATDPPAHERTTRRDRAAEAPPPEATPVANPPSEDRIVRVAMDAPATELRRAAIKVL